MRTQKIFCVITNLLGLNFSNFKVLAFSFLGFQFFVQLVGIYSVFYFPLFQSPNKWYRGNGIYSVTQIYQSIFPFIIQNFMIIKAFLMQNQQKYLSEKLRPKFTQKIGKCEGNFLKRMLFIVLVRVVKHFCIIFYQNNNRTTKPRPCISTFCVIIFTSYQGIFFPNSRVFFAINKRFCFGNTYRNETSNYFRDYF